MMSGQRSLFDFCVTQTKKKRKADSHRVEEGISEGECSTPTKKAKYEKEKRERKFLESWKSEFMWLRYDSDRNEMHCEVCRAFPQIAEKGNLFHGSSVFRKKGLKSHNNSAAHLRCMDADRAAKKPHDAPLPAQVRRMDDQTLQRLKKLFITAYFVTKLEMPFTAYPSQLDLQGKNGLEMGNAYQSDNAMRRCVYIHRHLSVCLWL